MMHINDNNEKFWKRVSMVKTFILLLFEVEGRETASNNRNKCLKLNYCNYSWDGSFCVFFVYFLNGPSDGHAHVPGVSLHPCLSLPKVRTPTDSNSIGLCNHTTMIDEQQNIKKVWLRAEASSHVRSRGPDPLPNMKRKKGSGQVHVCVWSCTVSTSVTTAVNIALITL